MPEESWPAYRVGNSHSRRLWNRACGLFSSLSKPVFGPPRCAPNDRGRLDEQFLGDHPYKRFAKCYIEVELVLRRCGGFALLLHQGRKEGCLIDRTSSFLGSLGVHMPSPSRRRYRSAPPKVPFSLKRKKAGERGAAGTAQLPHDLDQQPGFETEDDNRDSVCVALQVARQRHGSRRTQRWRKPDSNFRSPWRLGRSAPRKSRGNSSAVRVGT